GNSATLMRWDGTNYSTLAAFTEATGQEAHGLNTEPGFDSPGDGQYTLSSTSPLIDAGVLIPGINDDYSGSAPDIGAFESDLVTSMQIYMPSTFGSYVSPLTSTP